PDRCDTPEREFEVVPEVEELLGARGSFLERGAALPGPIQRRPGAAREPPAGATGRQGQRGRAQRGGGSHGPECSRSARWGWGTRRRAAGMTAARTQQEAGATLSLTGVSDTGEAIHTSRIGAGA